jgi:hypothetical protein
VRESFEPAVAEHVGESWASAVAMPSGGVADSTAFGGHLSHARAQ